MDRPTGHGRRARWNHRRRHRRRKGEALDRPFVLGTCGGVRIEFAVTKHMLGTVLNVDLINAVRVLPSNG